MNDTDILKHIEELVNEEHRLTQQAEQEGLNPDERARMHRLEVSLDQCWDLLRQRRALRSARRNPDQATERPADIVEHYQQ